MQAVIDQYVARDDLMRLGYAGAIEEGLLGALGTTKVGDPTVAEHIALKDAVLMERHPHLGALAQGQVVAVTWPAKVFREIADPSSHFWGDAGIEQAPAFRT